MFRSNNKQVFKTLIRPNCKSVCSKTHKNYFDIHADWFFSSYLPKKSLAYFLVGLNTAFFLYVNGRTERGRLEAGKNLSASQENLRKKEFAPFWLSSLGSRRIDDFVIENGLFLGVAKLVEKKHGLPLGLKLAFAAWFTGLLTSSFCLSQGFSRLERNNYPQAENINPEENTSYQYLSSHGIASSFLYFYLVKNRMLLAALPVAAADLYFFGPYYANGPLVGLTFGLII